MTYSNDHISSYFSSISILQRPLGIITLTKHGKRVKCLDRDVAETPMEGRSGFKECPRCGLRNRISTTKCDFCGFQFKDSTDEWSDYVDVLEELSKGNEVSQVDEGLSKRIESTLVEKTEVEDSIVAAAMVPEGPDSDVEAEPEVPEAEAKDQDQSEGIEAFVDSMLDEEPAEPSVLEPEEVQIKEDEDILEVAQPPSEEPVEVEDEERGLETADAAVISGMASSEAETVLEPQFEEETGLEAEVQEEIDQEGILVEERVVEAEAAEGEVAVDEEVESETIESNFEVQEEATMDDEVVEAEVLLGSFSAPAASMGLGAIIYLVAFGGFLFLQLDALLGWALAVVGSLFILFGVGRLYSVLLPISEARRRNMRS
jgi:hypothetical protein